ncbi:MAG: CPBP family intramembrane metalloprotease [Gemmatimonadota bacterium]|nr:CPBP family intramembrane metalloprotease [Gemmatimonadota bacterium]
MRPWLRRHLVILFVIATYAWTWGVGVPAALAAHGLVHLRISLGALTLAGFAPTVVALVLIAAAGGRTAIREVWLRLTRVSIAPAWYAAVVLAPILVVGSTLLVLPLLGAPVPELKAWYTPLLGVLFLIPLTGLFEEIGWRGLMLDELEQRMTPLRASMLVAAAWGPWHIPTYLRLMPEGNRTPLLIAVFLLAVFPLSMLFTWVYNRTERRLLPVIVLHASVDASVAYFFARLPTGELRPFIAWSAALWIIAALVLWKEGPALGQIGRIDRGLTSRTRTLDSQGA